jgi:uncharacterized protein YciI
VSYYAVVREAGPAWVEGGIFAQPGAAEHAAFMTGLAEDGFALWGGPLAGTETGHVRVLLVVDANSEAEVYSRLAGDPWVPTEQIVTVAADPWRILVGSGPARGTSG